jgi:putative ABC transport system permease protein
MLTYYFDLALRSFRASKGLSLLMVLALGLGIGACMTTLTVYHVLSGDPIPTKSKRLFNVQLDAQGMEDYKPGSEPTLQLTRSDAEALLRDKRGLRQVMMTGGYSAVQTDDAAIKPFITSSRFTSADFFAMFDAPFAQGGGWDARADADSARVVVISKSLNEQLFGGVNSVGRELRVDNVALRVVGVLKDWRPVPHFFDLTAGGPYGKPASLYVPFSLAMEKRFNASGNNSCWGKPTVGNLRGLNVSCAWLQYWVELPTAADAPAYRQYLTQYSEEQRRNGRFTRPANARARDVMDWLVQRQVLPGDVKLQLWLAFGFLLVCLTNTVGLLLAKALRRSAEIGVRRALGARKSDIFQQFVIEAGALGLAGGVLGLVLAALGLWMVRQSPAPHAPLAQLDWTMLALTFALALLASVLAGLLPAWRAASVTPAQQLKTQ